MSSLSSLTLKNNILEALVKPGGYKLKSAAFAETALALEREMASAKVLYERAESARDEVSTVLALLDPLIYSYLSTITDGKTKYEQGRIQSTSGREQQDAILTALAAIGICLQTGLMEHETINKMSDHLDEASDGLTLLEKDNRTNYSAHNITNLLDTLQSGPLAADLLGLADAGVETFSLPTRPAALKAREQASHEMIFGEKDIYTRPPTVRKGKKTMRHVEESSSLTPDEDTQLIVRNKTISTATSVSDFFVNRG